MAQQKAASAPSIKIFRPGRFTAVDGTVVEFSQADLEASAAAYDPVNDPAPLVVGHPKLDAPAYGWVGGLTVEGDHLVAAPDKIVPSFAEAVNDGHYPKVSASFYPPAHPANPKPGTFYLKHVGFLGAAAPAVKGLGTVSFAEEDGGPIATIEQSFEETIMPGKPEDKTVDFAEQIAALEAREQAIAKRETALEAREQSADEKVKAALHASNVSFAEQLVKDAKLAPAGKDRVIGLLDQLEATAIVSFGEADGEMTPAAAFKSLFEGAHPVVAFGEHAPGGRREEDEVETDPNAIADKAVAFAEEQAAIGRTITVAAAVRHVTKKAG